MAASDRAPGVHRQTRSPAAARCRVREVEPSSPRPRCARPPRTWDGRARCARAALGGIQSRCGSRSHSRERSARAFDETHAPARGLEGRGRAGVARRPSAHRRAPRGSPSRAPGLRAPADQTAAPVRVLLSGPVAGRYARWPYCHPRPPEPRRRVRGQNRPPTRRDGRDPPALRACVWRQRSPSPRRTRRRPHPIAHRTAPVRRDASSTSNATREHHGLRQAAPGHRARRSSPGFRTPRGAHRETGPAPPRRPGPAHARQRSATPRARPATRCGS